LMKGSFMRRQHLSPDTTKKKPFLRVFIITFFTWVLLTVVLSCLGSNYPVAPWLLFTGAFPLALVPGLYLLRHEGTDRRSESGELLRAIFNATADGILVVDSRGNITQANRQFAGMWHLPPEFFDAGDNKKLLGFILDKLETPQWFLKRINMIHQSSLEGKAEIGLKDGRIFELSSSPLIREGSEVGRVWDFKDVTERKRSETELRQSRAQLQAVLDASLDAITLTNEEGLFLACNKALMERWGRSREELIGHSAGEVLSAPIFADRLDRVRRTLATGQSDHFIDEWQGMWFENTIAPITDDDGNRRTVALYSRDITERKRAEKALQESERKYRELVDNANSIILRWNRAGEITYMNEFGQKFFGYFDSDILGRHVVGTIVPETESTGRDLRPLMEGIIRDPQRFERNINENMRRNGDHVWIDWTNKVVQNDSGEIVEILSIGSDITERKWAVEELQKAHDTLEQRIRERTAELVAANERLLELDRLKSQFLATMSHELRTPLNSIIGFTGILRQGFAGPVNDEQKKQLDMAYNSAKHLLSLINDLLDLSRIEAGKVELEHKRFNFADVVTEVIDSLKPMADQKGLIMLADLPGQGIDIMGDRKRCFQVLLNLANNAVKFTEHGEIRIMAGVDGNTLRVCVADTGIGIKPENLPMLFEAFRQVDGSARRVYEGTGLGLYLCRALLTLMGGEIGVESEFAKGSRFTFTIPLVIHEV
jgi:PAS domain S-box-containing protein